MEVYHSGFNREHQAIPYFIAYRRYLENIGTADDKKYKRLVRAREFIRTVIQKTQLVNASAEAIKDIEKIPYGFIEFMQSEVNQDYLREIVNPHRRSKPVELPQEKSTRPLPIMTTRSAPLEALMEAPIQI